MSKALAIAFVTLFVSSATFAQNAPPAAQSCEKLVQLARPHVKIAAAQSIAAGAFTPPAGASVRPNANPALFKALPAFCRVVADSAPSSDSDIKIEVWLPLHSWNGRLQAQGNGGFAGEIDYQLLGMAIRQGYAASGTDTGHAGRVTDASWALNHPEKITDFAYRAIHEMAITAKASIKAFYGDNPRHSYFAGCSNGGRQALMEAQRFPEDFDGILAGAPANYWTHLLSSAVFDAQVTTSDPASYIPTSKLPAIAHAVNEACDARDGVSDGIIDNPRQCHFDPATLLCKTGDSDKCLTVPQVTALKKLYQGAQDSRGRKIFPGFLPGAEEGPGGWGLWITGSAPGQSLLFAFGTGYFSNIVYNKANWEYKSANLDQAVTAADSKTARFMNATDPHLKPFQSRGGKLILYHGWNDAAISAINSIDYYNSVVGAMGQQTSSSFIRLYMMPGVQHCAGGPGPDAMGQPGAPVSASDPQQNVTLSLEQWVEKSVAPNAIIATKFAEDPGKGPKMTRPLCPYPQSVKYKGSGDLNNASSFVCAPPN
jgi:hypothetical protein